MGKRERRSVAIPILGLDVSKPGEYLDLRATSNCQDIDIRRALVQKRPGSVELGSPLGERIQALIDFDDGEETHFFRIGNTLAEAYNQTTDAWSSVLAAPLTGSESDRVSYAFPLLGGSRLVVISNGLDAILKNTGSGNFSALGGTPPTAKFLLDFGGYLLLGYITDDGSGNSFFSRVQWCDTGDIEEWSAGDAGSVDLLEDSEEMTGMGRFGQYVTIHKRLSIYTGYLTNTSAIFRFDRKATGAGTAANATIKTLPTGEQAFLARDGIRLFNGVTAPTIESPIMDELREFMNPEHVQKSVATLVTEMDEYHVGLPIGSQTEPETVYKFNYLSRQVYKDRRPLLVAVGEFRNTTESDWDSDPDSWDSDTTRWDDIADLTLNPVAAYGLSDGTVLKRTTGYNDDGAAIESFWDSKDFVSSDFDHAPGQMMRWQGLQIIAKGQAVTVYYSTNGGGTWTSIGTFSLSSDYPSDEGGQVGYFDVVATRCRFRFANAVVDEGFSLKQFFPEAVLREPR